MSHENNQPSLAVQAHCCQNLDEPSEKYPNATPIDTAFPGHDTFQNGIIENGKPTTFYAAATDKDIENIQNHNSNLSGFLSDESTINSCKNEHGVLDANLYADKTQTKPWRAPEASAGTDYTYRENVVALNVKWDELNKPENADLKARLCDSDGNLKVAFGQAEENTHWGAGGGNQYYINRDDFNEAVNRGVFEYDRDKALRECDGSLIRQSVSENEVRLMDKERQESIKNALSSCSDHKATTDVEKAKSLNDISPEKEQQINSAQAPAGNYIATPDPAYSGAQTSISSDCDLDLSADLGMGSAPVKTNPFDNGINNATSIQ